MAALLLGWIAEGTGDDPSRIHPGIQQIDGLALAGAVDAGEHDDDRKTRLPRELALHVEQLGAEHGHERLVFRF